MRSMMGDGEGPQKMADIVSPSWIAFARSGSPDIKGLPD
jgi:hypothetical protein